MGIVFTGIKKGLIMFWEDSILLIFVNILCFLAVLPALVFYNLMRTRASVVTSVANTLLLLPLVFFLFALYALLFDSRQGIKVTIKLYFRYLRSTWKQALIFGGVNLLFILMVGWNLRFYAQFEAEWAGIVQWVFVSISLIWIIVQLVMLPQYPRLADPKFKVALRNSTTIMGRYLIPVGVLVLLTAGFVVLTFSFQVVGIFFTFVLIAIMSEGIVGDVIIAIQEASPSSD